MFCFVICSAFPLWAARAGGFSRPAVEVHAVSEPSLWVAAGIGAALLALGAARNRKPNQTTEPRPERVPSSSPRPLPNSE
jgi:hypothetical protein